MIYWPFPYSIIHLSPSLSLPLSLLQQSATYLQNCTYHKVLLSAANKSVLRIVSKEIESPLNVLSNGCLGLQYCWVLAAYGSSEVKKRALLASFGWLFGGFFHADHFNHKNHSHEPDVENLRRIEFIHENWHSTSLYHPLTGQREAGRFPNTSAEIESIKRGHHRHKKIAVKITSCTTPTEDNDDCKPPRFLLPKLASAFFVISPILSDKACISACGIDLIRGNSNIQRKSATKYRHQHQEKMMGTIVLVLLSSLVAVSSGNSEVR